MLVCFSHKSRHQTGLCLLRGSLRKCSGSSSQCMVLVGVFAQLHRLPKGSNRRHHVRLATARVAIRFLIALATTQAQAQNPSGYVKPTGPNAIVLRIPMGGFVAGMRRGCGELAESIRVAAASTMKFRSTARRIGVHRIGFFRLSY